jgi:hypothetical protein
MNSPSGPPPAPGEPAASEAVSAAFSFLFLCQDMIDGRLGLLEGARQIAALEGRLDTEDREETALFRALAEEADRSPDARGLDQACRDIVLFSCRRILEKRLRKLAEGRAREEKAVPPAPRSLFRAPLPSPGPGVWLPAGVLCGAVSWCIAREGGGAFLRYSSVLLLPGAAFFLFTGFYVLSLAWRGLRSRFGGSRPAAADGAAARAGWKGAVALCAAAILADGALFLASSLGRIPAAGSTRADGGFRLLLVVDGLLSTAGLIALALLALHLLGLAWTGVANLLGNLWTRPEAWALPRLARLTAAAVWAAAFFAGGAWVGGLDRDSRVAGVCRDCEPLLRALEQHRERTGRYPETLPALAGSASAPRGLRVVLGKASEEGLDAGDLEEADATVVLWPDRWLCIVPVEHRFPMSFTRNRVLLRSSGDDAWQRDSLLWYFHAKGK